MQQLQLPFIFILIFLKESLAIDLCLFINCNNQNENGSGRSDNGPAVIQIDQDWIQPENSQNDQLYHFGNNANSMNWYDADEYCINKGGHLAEPLTTEESNFLKGYAGKYPNVNWWLGLREAEDCKCRSTDARAAVEFEANIDYNTLSGSGAGPNGYVKTKCPSIGNYEKSCGNKVWLWSYSGIRLSFSDWNSQSGEPNGANEHCVTMWLKGDYRWGDWHCDITADNNHQFKPVCQKDKNAQDFSTNDRDNGNGNIDNQRDDDETINNGNNNGDNGNNDRGENDEYDDYDDDYDLPDKTDCFDEGVTYKSARRDKLTTIHKVETAELCKEMCEDNDECNYWTWLRNRRGNNKCKLKSGILRSGFRRQKNRATSGTLLNGCSTKRGSGVTDDNDNGNLKNSDYCIEHGAVYFGGDEAKLINNLNSIEECRDRCLQESGCQYFSFGTRKRRRNRGQKRCLLYYSRDFEVYSTRRATSGSVLGDCGSTNIDQMSQCFCSNVEPFRKRNRFGDVDNAGGNSQVNIGDILGGIIDGRSSIPQGRQGRIVNLFDDFEDDNQEITARTGTCAKGQVNRCSSIETRTTTTTTTTTTTPKPLEQFTKGEYCIDYDVNYEEGDEFKKLRNIPTVEECRQKCLEESQCKYYVWRGSTRRKQCLLKSSGLWVPKYEEGTVSGTVDEPSCRNQPTNDYGFCDCVEFEPDYYDPDFVDLVETGDINVRSNTCPNNQGRRCYSKNRVQNNISSRIIFG